MSETATILIVARADGSVQWITARTGGRDVRDDVLDALAELSRQVGPADPTGFEAWTVPLATEDCERIVERLGPQQGAEILTRLEGSSLAYERCPEV